jgi:hypothetical protein
MDDADDIRLVPPAEPSLANRTTTIRRDAGPHLEAVKSDVPLHHEEPEGFFDSIGRMHHALMALFGADVEPPEGVALLENSLVGIGEDLLGGIAGNLGPQALGAAALGNAKDYPFVCLCNDQGRCVETCESHDAKGSECRPGPEKPEGEGSWCAPRKGEWR